MNYLYEKVSYLRGMAEGMEVSESSKEGKLMLNILDLLEEFADVLGEVREEVKELDEYVESIDEDLAEVEDELFEDDDEDDVIEVECPNCGEVMFVDDEVLDDTDDATELVCPSCHEKIYIEESCCDSDCCSDHHE
ncbi:hypothetical protein IZY60_03765 [Lutibacter sp. B2]|nr:hypothetical protein [Lutibacter sp. B2]